MCKWVVKLLQHRQQHPIRDLMQHCAHGRIPQHHFRVAITLASYNLHSKFNGTVYTMNFDVYFGSGGALGAKPHPGAAESSAQTDQTVVA